MKSLSLVALGALLVSCSSYKQPTNTNSSTHLTWWDAVKTGKAEMRAPASVKDADYQEMVKTMKKYSGWKTVPVGKAVTKESTYYQDGEAQTSAVVEMILKQRTSSYFVLSSYASGWELDAHSLIIDADFMGKELRRNLSTLQKTGASTYVLGYKTEIGDDSISCEVKVDFDKSPVFYNNTCKDANGQVFQESKTVSAKDVNLKSLEQYLQNISISVCPEELREEEAGCLIDSEKRDWSYLVK